MHKIIITKCVILLITVILMTDAGTLILQNNDEYSGCTDTYIESYPLHETKNTEYDGVNLNHGDEDIISVGAMRYLAG